MQNRDLTLGIDIGSIAVSAVLMDRNKAVLSGRYVFHNGDPAGTIESMLADFNLAGVGVVASSGSASTLLKEPRHYDSRISCITAARHFHPGLASLLIVGGEKFGLALFNEKGEYLNYRSNTSCAAGTGSFLEQQAKRLNLKGIEEFSEISYGNTGEIPKIASRCAVFAKTDLIHAQQEGYTLGEICDGLCFGLAKNVADTLFAGSGIPGPMVFAGGVSKNRAVVKHLSSLANVEIVTDPHSHLYGAIGAALCSMEDNQPARDDIGSPDDIIIRPQKEKHYHYDSLQLRLSPYPDFSGLEHYEYVSRRFPAATPVEVDIYRAIEPGSEISAYLGIDIGSTSTKAVLADSSGDVIAGLYTRTSGRPVEALQTVFECIEDIAQKRGCSLTILGAGTTGSGRKFIGEIIGADLVLDEITAHARAAYELDPETDTIIEIGGQDSKFTTMRNGMVTFSIMNNVCAAGTGSFIEEQAKKLGCPLGDYSDRAEGKQAPLSSDRCTVFMERDLNNYLAEGFSVDEILASVLHSVRDNYLTKVAIEKNIGKKVFFQGATAKNRALVAAFEQRLEKPIMVSRFCHLTGAMGVALSMIDDGVRESTFRGTGIHRAEIPVRTEVCELCTNHCKIRLADVNGETAAFGFLCGRDYETKRYVRDRSLFDLIREHEKVFSVAPVKSDSGPVIGIPAALHLFEELGLWKKFFQLLSLRTVTSEGYRDGIRDGKGISGAEFCAPLTALHGHAAYCAERADYVFLPVYVEEPKEDRLHTRNYCYYTQFSPSVVSLSVKKELGKKILSPVVRSTMGPFYMKLQLFRMLQKIRGYRTSFRKVSKAYDAALKFHRDGKSQLQRRFLEEMKGDNAFGIVFVGRPYTLLSRHMNNGIPDIFAKQGVKSFFQDMLPAGDGGRNGIEPLLRALHWRFTATIMEATNTAARMPGLYPVYVTSFKCTPDSYAVEYFKKVMDGHGKPYLILQLDEHDSSVGYETRIEAGIRAFRNHWKSDGKKGAGRYSIGDIKCGKGDLSGKTLLFPRWDHITCNLIEAVLRNRGLDVRIVDESRDAIQRSMRTNTGQCIPLSIMVQNAVDYIEKHGLDPEKTAVWTANSQLSCNIGMFPAYKKNLLEAYGRGMEKVSVYSGEIILQEFSISTSVKGYLAYMMGGYLRRIGCHIRPYEVEPGITDRTVEESVDLLYDALLHGNPLGPAVDAVVKKFESIAVRRHHRPKVAIFGDLYVRDNDVLNQDLIRTIERYGGEVVTTPYSELVKIVADVYIRKWFIIGKHGDAILSKVLSKLVPLITGKYERKFQRILPQVKKSAKRAPEDILNMFNVEVFLTGESMENLLKLIHLTDAHDDLALFVQTNPSYCCPSLVTEAMADRIEEVTGIPIVTIEYDGTGGSKNDDVIPYLRYLRRRSG